MNAFIQNKQTFGTVQKQLGAPWQKISPPSKLPKFICQPKLFLNKLVLYGLISLVFELN
jgi:hypothetical protein